MDNKPTKKSIRSAPHRTPRAEARARLASIDYLAWAWKVDRAKDAERAYHMPVRLFSPWWLDQTLDGGRHPLVAECDYKEIVLSLLFMAEMVRTGDA